MKKNAQVSPRRGVKEYAATAMQQLELYCAAHPGSPSAVRRPRLFFRSELWVALLGPSMEEGIVGIGPTVAAALRAFDAQYLAGLRPPGPAIVSVSALRRLDATTGRRYRSPKSRPKPRKEVQRLAARPNEFFEPFG
jgi:hypothetical protein